MQPAHMPTGLDYELRILNLKSTQNDEGPIWLYAVSYGTRHQARCVVSPADLGMAGTNGDFGR